MDHREGIPSDGVGREDIHLREWTLQRISSVGPRRRPESPPVMDEANPRSARSERGGSPIRGVSFFGSGAIGSLLHFYSSGRPWIRTVTDRWNSDHNSSCSRAPDVRA